MGQVVDRWHRCPPGRLALLVGHQRADIVYILSFTVYQISQRTRVPHLFPFQYKVPVAAVFGEHERPLRVCLNGFVKLATLFERFG